MNPSCRSFGVGALAVCLLLGGPGCSEKPFTTETAPVPGSEALASEPTSMVETDRAIPIEPPNREAYDRVDDNPFERVTQKPRPPSPSMSIPPPIPRSAGI